MLMSATSGAGLVFPVRDAGLTGQLVDRLKAGVVAGLGIFLARVASPATMRILSGCAAAIFVLPLHKKFNQRQRLPRPPKARLCFSEIPPDKSAAAAERAGREQKKPPRDLCEARGSAGVSSVPTAMRRVARTMRLQREVAADERGDGLLVVNGGDGLSELFGDRDGLDLAADLDGNGVGDEALDDRGVVQTLDGGPEKIPWVAQT